MTRTALTLAPTLALALTACGTPRAYMGLDLGTADVTLRRTALAARGGDKQAQLTLGRRFEQGAGVPQDPDRACRLYAMASRTTGGTMYVYSPPVGREKAGRVIPVSTPVSHGLPEASARRAAACSGEP